MTGAIRRSDMNEVVRRLAESGIEIVEITQGTRHRHATLLCDGRTRRMPLMASHSFRNWRNLHNWISDVRHKFGLVGKP